MWFTVTLRCGGCAWCRHACSQSSPTRLRLTQNPLLRRFQLASACTRRVMVSKKSKSISRHVRGAAHWHPTTFSGYFKNFRDNCQTISLSLTQLCVSAVLLSLTRCLHHRSNTIKLDTCWYTVGVYACKQMLCLHSEEKVSHTNTQAGAEQHQRDPFHKACW